MNHITSEQNTQAQGHTPLSVSVIDKIRTDHVQLEPRWKFLVGEYGVWSLWVLSVLLGALALAMMLFVAVHSGFVFYEATHDRMFDFIIDVLPYLWIVVFVLMAYVSHYNLRNTKRGYRYPIWLLLGSSLACSFVGGVVMHVAGMGYIVDVHAGKSFPLYPTLEERIFNVWQAPEQGRLIGVYQDNLEDVFVGTFTDAYGEVWSLNTAELNPLDLERLRSHEQVRVIGVLASSTRAYFHGCGVLPSSVKEALSIKNMRAQREAFIERMSEHHRVVMKAVIGTSSAIASAPAVQRVCAEHAAVMRVLEHNKK